MNRLDFDNRPNPNLFIHVSPRGGFFDPERYTFLDLNPFTLNAPY